MKKLLFLSLASGLMVQTITCRAATPEAGPVWAAKADGFATVETETQKGTTGGAGGRVVTVNNLADLEKYATSSEPLVILIEGTIAKEPFGKAIKVASNKTLLGLGTDATLLHGEIQLSSVSNVIIRNLTIRDSFMPDDNGKKYDYDAIQIDNSHHIWIDHCKLTHMADGLIDYRKGSDYLTVSWCVLSHQNKAFGVGWYSQTDKLRLTVHHTWIHDTVQRNPSLDNGTGHLYNNYLQNISSYGNFSRGKAKVVVENSVFEKVNNPLTRSPEAELVARGNILKASPSTDKDVEQGAAFNPKQFYNYKLDEAEKVPDLLKKYAGPQTSLGTAEMGKQMAAAK